MAAITFKRASVTAAVAFLMLTSVAVTVRGCHKMTCKNCDAQCPAGSSHHQCCVDNCTSVCSKSDLTKKCDPTPPPPAHKCSDCIRKCPHDKGSLRTTCCSKCVESKACTRDEEESKCGIGKKYFRAQPAGFCAVCSDSCSTGNSTCCLDQCKAACTPAELAPKCLSNANMVASADPTCETCADGCAKDALFPICCMQHCQTACDPQQVVQKCFPHNDTGSEKSCHTCSDSCTKDGFPGCCLQQCHATCPRQELLHKCFLQEIELEG